MDLQAASVPGTRVFVQDMLADGLVAKPDGPGDIFEDGDKSVTFDGEWKKAKLSEDEYRKLFADADERYAKMLTLLTAQIGKGGSGISSRLHARVDCPGRAHYGTLGILLRERALGSAVEHRLHTAGVSGSNPLAPTSLRSASQAKAVAPKS